VMARTSRYSPEVRERAVQQSVAKEWRRICSETFLLILALSA